MGSPDLSVQHWPNWRRCLVVGHIYALVAPDPAGDEINRAAAEVANAQGQVWACLHCPELRTPEPCLICEAVGWSGDRCHGMAFPGLGACLNHARLVVFDGRGGN